MKTYNIAIFNFLCVTGSKTFISQALVGFTKTPSAHKPGASQMT